MTTAKAEKVTTLITTELNTMGAAREATEVAYEAILPLINEAYARQAHKALGYDTWESYVHDLFGDQLARLGVDLRRRAAKELAEAGMSTPAIQPLTCKQLTTRVTCFARGATRSGHAARRMVGDARLGAWPRTSSSTTLWWALTMPCRGMGHCRLGRAAGPKEG
jgi:hypothetical protein